MLFSCSSHVLQLVNILALGFLLFLSGWGMATPGTVEPPTPPGSPTGRAVFLDSEAIPLRVPASGDEAEVVFTATGGRERRITVPAANGQAFFTLKPYALSPGDWTISAGKARGKLRIVSSIVETPFRIGMYGLYASRMANEAFMRTLHQDYGVNLLLVGGFPLPPEQADGALASEIRFTVGTVSGMHQPDGHIPSDYSHPEVIESCRYRIQQFVQHLHLYPAFLGVHLVDEPGLTWGVETPEGERYEFVRSAQGMVYASGGREIQPLSKVQPDDYVGPMAVEIQRIVYKQVTGKDAPDWRHPFADLDNWMDFMRWRTTVLGETFARWTPDVKVIDPRVINFSQIYSWSRIADGCYPREEAKGVDVLSTHAYIDGPVGFWYPAHETDAMRSGAWDKPLWMLPAWEGITPAEGVPACAYSTLARKVEGLLWPQEKALVWPQAKEVSQRILPLSAMLAQTQKLRDEVGIFFSRDQQLFDFAQKPLDPFARRVYEGRLYGAWMLAMAAHYPVTPLVEEELLAGTAKAHKALVAPGLTYARPEIVQALERYIADGGVLFLDANSTVKIKGAHQLPLPFPDWMNGEPESVHYPKWTDRRRFDTYTMPHIEEFTKALAPYANPAAECDNPMFMVTVQGADAGRYLWVVNMAQVDRWDPDRRPRFLVPATGTVTLPEGNYVAYDVFARKPLQTRTLTLHLDKGDARLYALMPASIAGVKITSAKRKPPLLDLAIEVTSKGEPVDAIIPLAVELIAPDGATFRKFYRATSHGKFSEQLPFGATPIEGRWTITVTELLSGKSATKRVVVKGSGEPFAIATPKVDIVDADRIAQALAKGNLEMLVLFEDEALLSTAKDLAAYLSDHGVQATSDKADNYLNERPTTPYTHATLGAAPLAINKQVMLLGNRDTNTLIARLVDTYNLCPRQLGSGYPGKGRALLYWAHGMFGIENDIIIIYADDEAGINEGIAALEALLPGQAMPGQPVVMAR